MFRFRIKPGSNQLLYLTAACLVALFGLASRRFGAYLPPFLAEYAGDTLWALMLFLIISAVAVRASLPTRTVAALLLSYAVEISQLYHAPWIDRIRSTAPGGLILGFGFLWSDLLCYTAGVALAVALEKVCVNVCAASR